MTGLIKRMNFMKHFLIVPLVSILLVTLSYGFVEAAAPKKIAVKKKWSAYTFQGKGGKVCYIASAPIKQRGVKGKKRGQPYALVTNRPSKKIKGEVNFIAGYNFKKGSSVKVSIGKKSFDLSITEGDGAWSSEPSLDAKLVKAMMAGNRMIVVGKSSRGTRTKDTYSLAGFTAMKKRIDRVCKK